MVMGKNRPDKQPFLSVEDPHVGFLDMWERQVRLDEVEMEIAGEDE